MPEQTAPFVVRNAGVTFAGDLASYIDRQVYLFGGYEQPQIACFLSAIPANRRSTLLDVGANAGTHSLACAASFAAVHAFEPNPRLWQQFEWNMAANRFGHVRLHKMGLADRDCDLTLRVIAKPNFGLGTFSTVQQYDLPLQEIATCAVRRGAGYLASIGVSSVDAIKIDVQGFEPEVLRGLREVLSRDRPVVWCEIGAGTLDTMATTDELAQLIPFAFRCYKMIRRQRGFSRCVGLQERSGRLDHGDYVLIPD